MALTVEELVGAVLSACSTEDRLVASTGLLSRALYAQEPDGRRAFFMIGSMGLTLALGAGVAATSGRGRVIVLDGDGSFLMGLAGLVLAADLSPLPLHHVVAANGCYASTGGQPLPGKRARLGDLAAAAGYVAWSTTANPDECSRVARRLWTSPGPTLLVVEVSTSARFPPRVADAPGYLAQRFRQGQLNRLEVD